MAGVAERIFDMIKPTVQQQGVKLWDVRFLKEGASHYLRVFIDSDEGISIDDCTNVSHAIDPIIDEADPIDVSYYLEVCSPGIERELSRPEHFEYACGKMVKLRLFKTLDGSKELSGRLISFGDELVIENTSGEVKLPRTAVAKAALDDFDKNR